MLTREQNERLTRVGPGTPGGELLRRYWQVLCPTTQLLGEKDRLRVRILGEDLLVYRALDGSFACIAERCPHRSASLYFGFIEPDGIRCCYHGWKFDATTGACLDRPFEQSKSTTATLRTYPVRQLGGLLFVYMGPHADSPPLLPPWDVLVRTDRPKEIRVLPDHNCNWLQIQENTADSIHTYYLHGHRMKVMGLQGGGFFYRKILSYDWSTCDWGVEKRVEYDGDPPFLEVRPPLIFPNLLRIPEGPVEAMHFRIPIDDEHTRIIWYGLMPQGYGPLTDDEHIPTHVEYDPPGQRVEDVDITTFYGQDRVVWETQGVIADRSLETLGATDRGIVLFRRQLAEQIDRVAAGLDPTIAVVHDEDEKRCIEFESTRNQPALRT
jgi:5,5'-dehydrodivanillate O-demethylase